MNGVVATLRSTLSPDIGIDLGTANTVVYERGAGIIVSEPSVVAYRRSDRAVIAVGAAAKELDGRAPGRIDVVRPLRGGTISDFHGAHTLIKTMVDRALAVAAAHRAAHHRLRAGLRDRHRMQGGRRGRSRRRPAHHDLRAAGGRGGDRRRARRHDDPRPDGRRHRRRHDRDRGALAQRHRRDALDQDRRRHVRRGDRGQACATTSASSSAR